MVKLQTFPKDSNFTPIFKILVRTLEMLFGLWSIWGTSLDLFIPCQLLLLRIRPCIIIIWYGLGEGCPNFKLPERDIIQVYREKIVKIKVEDHCQSLFWTTNLKFKSCHLIIFANGLHPDQTRQNAGPNQNKDVIWKNFLKSCFEQISKPPKRSLAISQDVKRYKCCLLC